MFIAYDLFGFKDGAIFKTLYYHPKESKLELSNGVYDEILLDGDMSIEYTTEQTTGWRYQTVLHCNFNGSVEGGSIRANDNTITSIKFQKRKVDELNWQDVVIIPYESGEKIIYEAIDKYIQNDFVYQYSLVPIAEAIMGSRVISDEITADFEGVFISDADNNYKLLYDIELSDIEHVTANHIFQPLNFQFPVISYGNLDYRQSSINTTFISTSTANRYDGKVDIRMEKLGREQLFKFLKNRKPKVLRTTSGESMLISIIGNPKETPNNFAQGIASVNFSYVEIGKMDFETLKANDLIPKLTGLF